MQFQNNKDKVLIIDFGSQVTKLIARRVRELGVYSKIITPKKSIHLTITTTPRALYFLVALRLLRHLNLKVFLKQYLKKRYQY